MKNILLILLLSTALFTAARNDSIAQDNSNLKNYYLEQKGSKSYLLVFQNDSAYWLCYYKNGTLSFCIESSYSIKNDTLIIKKLGTFIIKNNKLVDTSKSKQYGRSIYKCINAIDRHITPLKSYGIYRDSSKIIIPSHLIGDL